MGSNTVDGSEIINHLLSMKPIRNGIFSMSTRFLNHQQYNPLYILLNNQGSDDQSQQSHCWQYITWSGSQPKKMRCCCGWIYERFELAIHNVEIKDSNEPQLYNIDFAYLKLSSSYPSICFCYCFPNMCHFLSTHLQGHLEASKPFHPFHTQCLDLKQTER